MAEEHRVGDDAEEDRADKGAGDGQRGRPARRDARRDQPDQADGRRHEIEHGRKLRPDPNLRVGLGHVSVDSRHRGNASGSTIVLGSLPRHSRSLPGDRHGQGNRGRDDHSDGRGLAHPHRVECDADDERPDRERKEHAAQEPAVTEAHLSSPGRDPQPEEAADCPLQEDGGRVEADHRGPPTTGGRLLPYPSASCAAHELCRRAPVRRSSRSSWAPERACPQTAGPRWAPRPSTRFQRSRPVTPMSTACLLGSTRWAARRSPRTT